MMGEIIVSICICFFLHCDEHWEILNTFQRLYGNSQTPMIIIKPDLVIKWANSNLVLHRVREHLCVFLCVFMHPYVAKYTWCMRVSKCTSILCVYFRRKSSHTGIFAQACSHPSSGKKRKQKNTQTLPHPFSFSSLFSIFCTPLSFCITYKGSRFLQNEATYGRYANEITARGLEWDTIYPKSWLSIMAGD